MRMKSIANLASDTQRRNGDEGGDEDTFGADDADWGVYRTIATRRAKAMMKKRRI